MKITIYSWSIRYLMDMTPAHRAVEMEDLEALHDLIDRGVDINEEHEGLTLLHHAIDVEIDSHTQTGDPLHVDMTAYLLARGADPQRRSGMGSGISAEHMAHTCGHWLASCLIAAWIRARTEAAADARQRRPGGGQQMHRPASGPPPLG